MFGDLTYNNKVIAPIGDPTEELAALYKKKDEDYNYVVDTTNALENALANFKSRDIDRPIVEQAKDKLRQTVKGFTEQGDLENRILDTKRLAQDITNNYGLNAVKESYEKQQQYVNELKERVGKDAKDGGISMKDYNRALQDMMMNQKAVSKDEFGSYMPESYGRRVLNNYNFSDRIAERLKGFKANETPLYKNGQLIVRDPGGSGYMVSGTQESVSEEELIHYASASLMNDPDFIDRIDEELYYETRDKLRSPDGENRELDINDVTRRFNPTTVSRFVKEKYNEDDLQSLVDQYGEGAVSNRLYRDLLTYEMTNKAIEFGVGKESYVKYKNQYHKDWKLQDAMKQAREKADAFNSGLTTTYYTKDNLSTDDITKSAKVFSDAKKRVETLKAEQNKVRANGDIQSVKNIQNEIDKATREINILQSKSKSKIFNQDEIRNQISSTVKNLNNVISHVSAGNQAPKIQGLDINEGVLEDLVMASYAGEITNEDTSKYVNIDRDKFMLEMAAARINHPGGYDIRGQQLGTFGVADKAAAMKAIQEQDSDALYNSLTPEAQRELNQRYDVQVNRSAGDLRRAAQTIAANIKDKAEKGEYTYNSNYRGYIAPDMSAEERRNHPMAQLEHLTSSWIDKNKSYYDMLYNPSNKLDVKTMIEEEHGVSDEDGEILWGEATLQPLIDRIPDENGNYHNSMMLQVDIKTGDKTTKSISVPVTTEEPTYNAKANEALFVFRNNLAAKGDKITYNEQLQLSDANMNLFNMTEEGRMIDLMNLNDMENGEVKRIDLPNGNSGLIKAFDKSSPTGMTFYLMHDNGNYWAEDSQGNKVAVTEEELASREYTALGANNLHDLKMKIANIGYNSGAFTNN